MPRDINLNISARESRLRDSLYEALARAVTDGGPAVRAGRRRLRVLDVGAGRGELLRVLSAGDHEAVGLDPEPECVAAAGREGHCLQGGIGDLPDLFEPGEFDVVVCSHVLEHLPDPIGALRILHRLDAVAYVLAVPNLHRPIRLLRALAGRSTADHPAHLYGWGRPEFEAALRAAGLVVDRWYTDRVTVSPLAGRAGGLVTRALAPVEVRLLPRLLPTLASSLIALARPVGRPADR